jgi:hypothetical protein
LLGRFHVHGGHVLGLWDSSFTLGTLWNLHGPRIPRMALWIPSGAATWRACTLWAWPALGWRRTSFWTPITTQR